MPSRPPLIFRSHAPTRMGRTVAACCGLMCLTGWLHGAQTNQLSSDLVTPKSVFVSEGDLGRDPFFPASVRLHKKTSDEPTKSAPVKLDFSRLLRLTGITGGTNPIAAINGLTFAVGEEQEVKVDGQKVKIRVREIHDKSVVVSIANQSEPVELKLRDGLLPFTE